jgi:hypothetical protein
MNTLETARRLGAHFTREQAEAIAEAVSESESNLVTKDYLDARFAEFESRINTRFAEADNKTSSEFLRVQGAFGKMEERIKLLTFLMWPVAGGIVLILLRLFLFKSG